MVLRPRPSQVELDQVPDSVGPTNLPDAPTARRLVDHGEFAFIVHRGASLPDGIFRVGTSARRFDS